MDQFTTWLEGKTLYLDPESVLALAELINLWPRWVRSGGTNMKNAVKTRIEEAQTALATGIGLEHIDLKSIDPDSFGHSELSRELDDVAELLDESNR